MRKSEVFDVFIPTENKRKLEVFGVFIPTENMRNPEVFDVFGGNIKGTWVIGTLPVHIMILVTNKHGGRCNCCAKIGFSQ